MASTASFIAQFNHRNIKILQSMGYEVHVAANFTHYGTLSAKSNEQFMAWLASKKVVVHNIPVERGLGKLRQNVAVLFFLNHLMKENQFKIVHVHTPIASVLGRLAALKNHVPVVYTAHGFHFSKTSAWINWLIFPIEWLFSFCTSELLLINQEDYLLAKRWLHAKNTQYVPGVGINFRLLDQYNISDHLSAKQELLATYHLPETSRILISVGELSKRKNHRIVIEALAMLDLPDINFVIAGRGSQKKNLTDLAKHLGIENQIHFLNYTKNIRYLHLAADLAVLPSLREGLSRAGLEAIRDGVYLLGSDIRGIKDYILNEEIGRVFDPLDAKALSILIKNNIQRPRQNLTNTTVQRLMMFDRAAVDKQMREIYQSIGE